VDRDLGAHIFSGVLSGVSKLAEAGQRPARFFLAMAAIEGHGNGRRASGDLLAERYFQTPEAIEGHGTGGATRQFLFRAHRADQRRMMEAGVRGSAKKVAGRKLRAVACPARRWRGVRSTLRRGVGGATPVNLASAGGATLTNLTEIGPLTPDDCACRDGGNGSARALASRPERR
jgi:hypothetical protein